MGEGKGMGCVVLGRCGGGPQLVPHALSASLPAVVVVGRHILATAFLACSVSLAPSRYRTRSDARTNLGDCIEPFSTFSRRAQVRVSTLPLRPAHAIECGDGWCPACLYMSRSASAVLPTPARLSVAPATSLLPTSRILRRVSTQHTHHTHLTRNIPVYYLRLGHGGTFSRRSRGPLCELNSVTAEHRNAKESGSRVQARRRPCSDGRADGVVARQRWDRAPLCLCAVVRRAPSSPRRPTRPPAQRRRGQSRISAFVLSFRRWKS